MARAWRIELPNGRYHVTARGNEQHRIFRQDADRLHLLSLLEELPERFGARIHAYVLMDNHYHLMLETPEANLSRAMQWLNVSYSVWFNRRHQRNGHLFQGRFWAVVVEDDAGWQTVGRYLHLNPVRVAQLGLDKRRQAASQQGAGPAPSPVLVAERLRLLRQYRWSSYPAYAGCAPGVPWLTRTTLGRLCGGRTEKEQQAALRNYTEQAVREGVVERPWERLVAGVVLGSETFAQQLTQGRKVNEREQPQAAKLARKIGWPEVVRAVETVKGERWDQFCQRYGDWGRDVALWVAQRTGRLRLVELAALVGIDYAAVGTAISRFRRRMDREPEVARLVKRAQAELSND